jgi:hypothetical protein
MDRRYEEEEGWEGEELPSTRQGRKQTVMRGRTRTRRNDGRAVVMKWRRGV